MKLFKSTLLALTLLGLFNFTGAQQKIAIQKADENSVQSSAPYRIDPQPLLREIDKKYGIDYTKAEPANRLSKVTSWNFTVGSTKSWWASNFSTNEFYQVPSTCRSVGTNCYIFVENAIWGTKVDQNAVDAVRNAFDNQTPANPAKGVYQTDVETFGDPPDVDNDPKIVILILDIIDGYVSGSNGGFVAGYFHSVNEITNINSNKAEIYYLDANPTALDTPGGLNTAMSTTAHEFQHMIHYNYHQSKYETFFNEGMSLIAEVVNGYPLREQTRYSKETNHYLLDWRSDDNTNVLTDYSRAARFAAYMYDQYGVSFLKSYVQYPASGISALTAILSSYSSGSRNFGSFLEDWFIANTINDVNLDWKWGYKSYPNMTSAVPTEYVNPNTGLVNGTIAKYGAQYLTFTGGSNLSISFDFKGANLRAYAVKYKAAGGSPEVELVQTPASYSVPAFGSTYNKVTFVVLQSDQNAFSSTNSFAYSYQATGTFQAQVIEKAWDISEPTGYLQLTTGDSVAVQFDALPGAKLDSIKVALRGTMPINGGVYEYVGLSNQLGGKKLASITATSTLSSAPAVVNPSGEYPYAAPYSNWVKVDLRQYNLTADKPFAVEFPVGAEYPSTNRVMVTSYQSSVSYHSFAFQSSTGKWLYYSISGQDGYIFLFLIRAYVSYGTTDASEPIELLPSAFNLEQNYPNPFNPSTIIKYNLASAGNVAIRIYDALGREIKTLVSADKPAGSYTINWDGTDNSGSKVSTGIYFYRLVAGDFVQTKKMILMK